MLTSPSKKDRPKRDQFAKLENNYLIQRQAALKYKIPLTTLYRWAQNPNLIRTKNVDAANLVNETDVAYVRRGVRNAAVEKGNGLSTMTAHHSSENQKI